MTAGVTGEAVEAAAKRRLEHDETDLPAAFTWDGAPDMVKEEYRTQARADLTAALPYLVEEALAELEKQEQYVVAYSEVLAKRDARIKALSVAMVTAVVPLEAILMSGTLKEHCPELQNGIVKGITAVRAALDPSP